MSSKTNNTSAAKFEQNQERLKATMEAVMPGLYEIFKGLWDAMRELEISYPQFYWGFGHQLLSLATQENGKAAVMALQKNLEVSPTDALAAMNLARRYPSKKQIADVLKRSGPSGKVLTWSVLRHLVATGLSDEEHEKWLGVALSQELEASALLLQIRGMTHGTAAGQQSAAGPKIKLPKSVAGLFSKWLRSEQRTGKENEQLFGKLTTMVDVLGACPADQFVSEQLRVLDEVEAAIQSNITGNQIKLDNVAEIRRYCEQKMHAVVDESQATAKALPGPEAPAEPAKNGKKTSNGAAPKASTEATAPEAGAKAKASKGGAKAKAPKAGTKAKAAKATKLAKDRAASRNAASSSSKG